MDEGSAGGICISYRRDDTAATAGRIRDKLSEHFGESRVFMDIDSIEPGSDFPKAIRTAVGLSQVLLVLIGRQWLILDERSSKPRIFDPSDWVTIEIKTALQNDIRLIPILVDGAIMPSRKELPPTVRDLADRQAFEITNKRFNSSLSPLISFLDEIIFKWKLEDSKKGVFRRKLWVSRKESHLIVYENDYIFTTGSAVQRIRVDGEIVVADRSHVWMRDYPFDIIDGGERFQGLISAWGDLLIDRVARVRLVIDGHLIYDG